MAGFLRTEEDEDSTVHLQKRTRSSRQSTCSVNGPVPFPASPFCLRFEINDKFLVYVCLEGIEGEEKKKEESGNERPVSLGLPF